MKPKVLKIKVVERVIILDTLHTWKPWIGKLKHFFTVKPLPPTRG